MKVYGQIMQPIAGAEEWEKINRPMTPPLFRKPLGRPKNTYQLPSRGEAPPPPGTTKLPNVYYTTITCGRCHQVIHNAKTCLRRQQADGGGVATAEDVAVVEAVAAETARVAEELNTQQSQIDQGPFSDDMSRAATNVGRPRTVITVGRGRGRGRRRPRGSSSASASTFSSRARVAATSSRQGCISSSMLIGRPESGKPVKHTVIRKDKLANAAPTYSTSFSEAED